MKPAIFTIVIVSGKRAKVRVSIYEVTNKLKNCKKTELAAKNDSTDFEDHFLEELKSSKVKNVMKFCYLLNTTLRRDDINKFKHDCTVSWNENVKNLQR